MNFSDGTVTYRQARSQGFCRGFRKMQARWYRYHRPRNDSPTNQAIGAMFARCRRSREAPSTTCQKNEARNDDRETLEHARSPTEERAVDRVLLVRARGIQRDRLSRCSGRECRIACALQSRTAAQGNGKTFPARTRATTHIARAENHGPAGTL